MSGIVASLAATTEQGQNVFEITESLLLEKTDVSLAILNEPRDIGVAISMDDFGTGQVQGYLISSPRPAHEIPAMIRSLTSPSDGNISSLPLHRGASRMRVVRRMGG